MANSILRELNVSVQDSPKSNNNQATIELSNYVLRKLDGQDNHLIDTINSELKCIQLNSSERLLTRLRNEISRTASEYKKIKSGHKKSKFDKKLKQISVQGNEIKSAQADSISSPLSNPGKRIDNVSTPNRNRVVSRLKENLDKSLDFIESYGVLPRKVICETLDGKPCVLNVDGTPQNTSYNNLPPSSKHEVKSMLHVCDNSMISDAAYHEISMRVPSMPRSHHLIDCRNEMNSKFDVNRTPGMLPGSYMSLESELIQICRETNPTTDEILKIKISGDGAKVSRVSNFLVVSFSVLGDNCSNSHINQRVLAVVNCDENYTNLTNCIC